MTIKTLVLTVLCLVATTGSVLATTVYDANADLKAFELSTSGAVAGSNGVWQYGTAPTLAGIPNTGAFSQFPGSQHNDTIVLPGVAPGDLQGWQANTTGDLVPAVAVNVTNHAVASSCCGTYDLNEMWVHSAPNGYSVVQWTSPGTGFASYSATFINEGGNGQPVFVLVNNVSVFNGTSAGSNAAGGTVANSAFSIPVVAGSTIDFAIGGYNSAGLFASVTLVPEPASVVLFGLGAVALFFVARRRRNG